MDSSAIAGQDARDAAGPMLPESVPSPLQQLKVKQWSFVRTEGLAGEFTYQVSGELENPTSTSFTGVYLDVALYDQAGNIVATSTVSASNVGAGETAIISGYVIDKTLTPDPKGKIRVSTGH